MRWIEKLWAHRVWVSALILVLLLLLSGCSSTPTPPQLLSVTAAGRSVPVMLGSYCWRGLLRAVCADMAGPDEMLRLQREAPPVLSPGSVLQLSFRTEPDPESLSVSRFADGQPSQVTLGPNGSLPVPPVPGLYTYMVAGHWPRGSVSYVLWVEVTG